MKEMKEMNEIIEIRNIQFSFLIIFSVVQNVS